MRQLKFRQIFIKGVGGTVVESFFHYFEFTDGFCSGVVSAALSDHPVDQFTGQKDRDGKEIYENDILILCDEDKTLATVKFAQSESAYILFDEKNQPVVDLSCDWPDKKVVGNIYGIKR